MCQSQDYEGVAELANDIMDEFESWYIDKRFYAEYDDQYYCNLDIEIEVLRMGMPAEFLEAVYYEDE